MEAEVHYRNATFVFKAWPGADISIPVHPHGEEHAQLDAFHIGPAASKAIEGSGFVCDVRRGGNVNCEVVHFCPHGNGTHTECVGHVTHQRISIAHCMQHVPVLLPCLLVTIEPARLDAVSDPYDCPRAAPSDLVISHGALLNAIGAVQARLGPNPVPYAAIVVRTLPNADEKKAHKWSGTNPPYFTPAAMSGLRRSGVVALVTDLPSVDREDDAGLLLAHHAFFGVHKGAETIPEEAMARTITELAYAPPHVHDGVYMLSLQVAPFHLDASPSRPVLLPAAAHPAKHFE